MSIQIWRRFRNNLKEGNYIQVCPAHGSSMCFTSNELTNRCIVELVQLEIQEKVRELIREKITEHYSFINWIPGCHSQDIMVVAQKKITHEDHISDLVRDFVLNLNAEHPVCTKIRSTKDYGYGLLTYQISCTNKDYYSIGTVAVR